MHESKSKEFLMRKITSPAFGVFLVHDEDQPPTYGTAVYRYNNGTWVCQDDCIPRGACDHIQLTRERFEDFIPSHKHRWTTISSVCLDCGELGQSIPNTEDFSNAEAYSRYREQRRIYFNREQTRAKKV